MTDPIEVKQDSTPETEPVINSRDVLELMRENREFLQEIRKQNLVLKRYLFVFGAGLAVMLLMQFEVFQQIFSYAIVVCIIMAVLLTAPLWSQVIVFLTDRIPWFPKRKN